MAQSEDSVSVSSNTSNSTYNGHNTNKGGSKLASHSMSLDCRMYEESYPNVDDLVVVQVKSVVEMGAYCSLLEYNNIEGMILMSEMSRRRIRSVNKVIRVGRQEIVAVLRVNQEKGYIDLSKKRVSAEEVKKVEQRWFKSKSVHSIMRHCAKKSNYSVEQLYTQFGWPITKIINPNTGKPFEHIYDGFKYGMENREKFLQLLNIDQIEIPRDIISLLFENISHRLKPQVVTIRAGIECTCFTKLGIIAIRNALKEGLKESDDEFVVKISLVAPPLYNISLSTLNPPKGIQKILNVIKIIETNLKGNGGTLVLKSNPKVITNDMKANVEINDSNKK